MSRSTSPSEPSPGRVRRARNLRRAFFVTVCAVLVAAATGLLGVHTVTKQASGGGYDLTVTYDDRSRGGLPARFDIEVRRAGGFGGEPVVVAVGASYLDGFDENGLDPDPMSTTADADRVIFTFETPTAGDVLAVSFDSRVQPGIQLRRLKGEVSVLGGGAGGQVLVSTDVGTFVLP